MPHACLGIFADTHTHTERERDEKEFVLGKKDKSRYLGKETKNSKGKHSHFESFFFHLAMLSQCSQNRHYYNQVHEPGRVPGVLYTKHKTILNYYEERLPKKKKK